MISSSAESVPANFSKLSTSLSFPAEKNSATTRVLTKFTLFPNLPPELRRTIWKSVCDQPRLITIEWFRILDYCISNNFPPAILQVCAESRTIGLKFYKLRRVKKFQNKTYINFAVDIIYIASDVLLWDPDFMRDEQWIHSIRWFNDIRYLALPINQLGSRSNFHRAVTTTFTEIANQIGAPLTRKLFELILVDGFHASHTGMIRYLVPLKLKDTIKWYPDLDDDNSDIPEVVQVKDYLQCFNWDMRKAGENWQNFDTHFGDVECVDDKLPNDFPRTFRVMQLRYAYREGVESLAPANRKRKNQIWKPIYLGELKKAGAEGGWEIVRC